MMEFDIPLVLVILFTLILIVTFIVIYFYTAKLTKKPEKKDEEEEDEEERALAKSAFRSLLVDDELQERRKLTDYDSEMFMEDEPLPDIYQAVQARKRDLFYLDKARLALPKYDEMPILNDEYLVPIANLGLEVWDFDAKNFRVYCHIISKIFCFFNTKPGSAAVKIDKPDFINGIFKPFIKMYIKKLEDVKFGKMPFGDPIDGIRPFSLTSTRMMAYYLLVDPPSDKNKEFTDLVIDTILKILILPTQSLGQKLKGWDAVHAAAPWLIAQYYKNADMKALLKGEAMEYVHDFLKLPIQRKPGLAGLHMDMALFIEPAKFSFKPLDTKHIAYYFALDNDYTKHAQKVRKEIKKIIYHPKIAISIPPINHLKTLKAKAEPSAKYGIEVIPTAKYIRYFHKNFAFVLHGQSGWQRNFLLDFWHPIIDNTLLYWIQYRTPMNETMLLKVPYPQVGFILRHKDFKTYQNRVGLEPEKEFSDLKTKKFEEIDDFRPIAKSFVIKYKHIGVFYQNYELNYLDGVNCDVTEKIIIDSKKETIDVKTLVNNKSTKTDAEEKAEEEKAKKKENSVQNDQNKTYDNDLVMFLPLRSTRTSQQSHTPLDCEVIKSNETKKLRFKFLLKNDGIQPYDEDNVDEEDEDDELFMFEDEEDEEEEEEEVKESKSAQAAPAAPVSAAIQAAVRRKREATEEKKPELPINGKLVKGLKLETVNDGSLGEVVILYSKNQPKRLAMYSTGFEEETVTLSNGMIFKFNELERQYVYVK